MQRLFNAPIQNSSRVIPFPGKNGNAARCDGGRSIVLRGKNIAAGPTDFRTEFNQSFDQNGRFDRHMQAAGDLRAL